MNPWDAFLSLPRPSGPGFYSIERGTGRFRVGRSYENYPALLIELEEPKAASSPRRLANLTYTPPRVVDVASSDGAHQRASLAVLECRTTDHELGAYFYRIVSSVLLDDSKPLTEHGFESALDALVTLFRSLQRPPVRTIEGLWAELAVILWAAQPAAAMSSWHSSQHALHDFAAGSSRLEVKASLKGLREHAFLLDQLASVGEGSTIIASILLDEAESGTSVFDLVDAIAAIVGQESAARLQTIVANSLGTSWRDGGALRFSADGARASLRLYAAEDVPTIPQPLPPEVKDVRFTVDLSSTSQLDFTEARARGALFAQLLPIRP